MDPGVATPVARITFPNGSPQKSYFLGPEGRLRKASRWRDDWEQLDVLVCYPLESDYTRTHGW